MAPVGVIDFLNAERQFAEHSRPVYDALPEHLRGWFELGGGLGTPSGNAVLVASHADLKRARELGYGRIAYLEHGAGQSYGGTEESARHTSYAGGDDHEDVELFLVPGPHPALRWHQRYPEARVEMVGCPKLDRLPREGEPGVVAVSFHFHAMVRGADESNGLWRWYQPQLRELAERFTLIGHAHPRWANRIRPWFERIRVPFVERFEDVCRQASLYAVDNSSTLFEFAATGRPVVVLNGPPYRRRVEHGLRFWSASHVGLNATPANVGDVIARALTDPADVRERREAALSLVYRYRYGAAKRAADALTDWALGRAAA